MTLTYSNPRRHATVENWPMSGSTRGVAVFDIEARPGQARPGRGERAVRVTRTSFGRVSAPKLATFAAKARIVDGDDGRTYIINLTSFRHISVHAGDMKHSVEAIFEEDPRYAEVLALFDEEAGA